MRLPYRAWMLAICLLAAWPVQAQDKEVEIREKATVFIPKLDLFWAGVVIADDFPTFFPLELEVNFPAPRISLTGIVSPWYENYQASETTRIKASSMIGGLGLRYYALPKAGAAAQGFFVEPAFFLRRLKTVTTLQASSTAPRIVTENTGYEMAAMVGLGYQYNFWGRLYAQGRLSVGISDTGMLKDFRSGEVLFLPWLGLGYAF